MRFIQLVAAAALTVWPAASVAQTTPEPSAAAGLQVAGEPAAPTAARVTATGCLERAADGRTFVLTHVQSTPGTVDSGSTSPAAGMSATGEAPSGAVSARTPTGSTALETPAPTPEAGTPGETASPASPSFRRPAAAGTSGTVAGHDSRRREYRLLPGSGVSLHEHLGHTVEVSGLLRAASADASNPPSAENKARSGAEETERTQGAAPGTPIVQALEVERLRHLRPTCGP